MSFNIKKTGESMKNLGEAIRQKAMNFLRDRAKESKNNTPDQGSIKINALTLLLALPVSFGIGHIAGGLTLNKFQNTELQNRVERQVESQKPKAITNITKTGEPTNKLDQLKQTIGGKIIPNVQLTPKKLNSQPTKVFRPKGTEYKGKIENNSQITKDKEPTILPKTLLIPKKLTTILRPPIGSKEATKRIQELAEDQKSFNPTTGKFDNVNTRTGERETPEGQKFNPRGPLRIDKNPTEKVKKEFDQNLKDLEELAKKKVRDAEAEKKNQQKKSK